MRLSPSPFVALAAVVFAPSADAHDLQPATDMAGAAEALLATLTPDQRTQAVIPFDDSERMNWHYVPRGRRGLPFKQMTQEQRMLTHALLASALSPRGYGKLVNIISLEAVLAALENNPRRRDPELYYLSVFGTPGTEPWGWRLEGHHVSLNLTVAAGAASVTTPQMYGANPATVREGPRAGFRALAAEEDLGREFVTSLSPAQRDQAVIMARAPADVLNGPGRADTKPEGIAWADLDAAQRELLLSLVREYLGRFRPELAGEKFAALEAAGLDKLHFAWAGPVEKGAPHYYRVQGGTFVLEYDNVQNGANHVHSVWRDLDGDFGADILAEHYRQAHAH